MKRSLVILVFSLIFTGNVLAQQQLVSPGDLHHVHERYEGITNCTLCHEMGKKVTNQKCLTCHSKIALNIQEEQGYHFKNKDRQCSECHTEHKGRDFPIIDLDKKTFNHDEVGFKLEGAHKEQDCQACHINSRSYLDLDTRCVSCHADVHDGKLGANCEACHSTIGFRPSIFKHKDEDFQSIGKHQQVDCDQCHYELDFVNVSTNCNSCHEDEHKGLLGQKCEDCHFPEDFNQPKFDHNVKTKFKLEGKHTELECEACHPTGFDVDPDKNCVSCHDDEHKAQLSQKCEDCHQPTAFSATIFEHKKPHYELEGIHRNLDCDQCHNTADFRPLSKECTSCHEESHKGQMSQQDCKVCHEPTKFTTTIFKHDSTNYKLEGTHNKLDCDQCHTKGDFRPLNKECITCHEDEHFGQMATVDCQTCHNFEKFKPSIFKHKQEDFQTKGKHADLKCEQCHKNNQFRVLPTNCSNCHEDSHYGNLGEDCQSCHNFNSWENLSYDHHHTDFPLKGQHLNLNCEECHKNQIFRGTPTECVACHLDPHEKELGVNCQKCHTEENWEEMKFDHMNTSFVLMGQHQYQECDACHKNNIIKGTPVTCYGCHKADYEGTTDPNHIEMGFSSDCEYCHRQSDMSWDEAKFEHNDTFELIGHHQDVSCKECHIDNVYQGTPQDCYTCHWVRRQDDPWQLKLGTNCEDCHSPEGWTPAPWDHTAETGYELVGQHQFQDCTACHTDYKTTGMSTECYSCHKDDYEETKEPIHSVANFGTDCEECHRNSDMSWQEGYWAEHETFFHLRTSINGHHDGFTCFECHSNQWNMKDYYCLSCHAKTDMDAAHSGVDGYRYRNNKCLKCHENGEKEP